MMFRSNCRFTLILSLCLVTVFASHAADALYEQAPVHYSATPVSGPIGDLKRRIESGEIRFDGTDEKAFLKMLLDELDIPVESQVLVFSKTSHQNARISPKTPRAIYFNDDLYLGWVQGGVIEIAGMSPGLGVTFHLLDHRSSEKPLRLERPASCLNCHAGSSVNDLPGVLVRSVFPAADGQPILSAGSFMTGHASPLKERWGGWYVTGLHGEDFHMGNVIARELDRGAAELDRSAGANRTNLAGLFNTEPYLTDSSDIVALMLLEHQVGAKNILSQAATLVRVAMHRQQRLREELGEPDTGKLTGTSLTIATAQTERILRHLLFTDEILLPDDGIQGRSGFIEAFQKNARRDRKGRSLKDLKLKHWLFRYRCSYMIYSRAFEDLPRPLKELVYSRLLQILDGRDQSETFAHLGRHDRQAIKEILLDTKEDFAQFARESGSLAAK